MRTSCDSAYNSVHSCEKGTIQLQKGVIPHIVLLTGLRRDSSFFGGTFGARPEFDRTLAKTEAPTELAQLVIVSRRTLTTLYVRQRSP